MKKSQIVLLGLLALLLPISVLVAFVSMRFPIRYMDEVRNNAGGLDYALVLAVIRAESGFRPRVASGPGAQGLMQIMPATALENAQLLGLDDFEPDSIWHPQTNIDIGSFYLSRLIAYFGDQQLALAAYNAGRGNVRRWLADPAFSQDGLALDVIPFPETANYLRRVRRGVWVYRVRLFFGG